MLIVTFAMLILLIQQAWQLDYGPKPELPAITETMANNQADLPSTSGSTTQTVSSQNPTTESTPSVAPLVKKTISVKTDVLDLKIDLTGATIVDLDLLAYPTEKSNTAVETMRALIGMSASEKNSSPIRLFDSHQEKLSLAQSGLIADNNSVVAPNHYTEFKAERDHYELQPGQDEITIPLSWTDNSGLTVTKSFTLKRGSYEVLLEQKVKNDTGKLWSGRQYSQLLKAPDNTSKTGMLAGGMRAYAGGVIYTEKDKYQKVSFDDMMDKNLDVVTKGGWTAFIQHYFATAWIPPADQENHFYSKTLNQDHYVIGTYSSPVTINPGAEAQFIAKLFAGPKIQPMMEQSAFGLELTVDYGLLTFIGKPIYGLLNKIHQVIGNWGVAIIGVTLCIKLLFFPLTQSSFRSMAKMRKVQPRLKELQERFAGDRQRFNNEMMLLYKKEQVNPLGGCLPILIQIPVFMCLYWVLSETVEFRQAPFILWIQDLSVQDPFYVLPIIMGITMKIQQSLNPAPIDPIQAKVMKMFPIVFTIFFLFFPSGLVLYWAINNTLSILQQWYITKQIAKSA